MISARWCLRWWQASVIAVLALVLACGDGTVDPPPQLANRAPVGEGVIPALTVAVGQTKVLDVSQYFADPDGDGLSYSAETSDPRVATTSISGGALTVTGVARGTASVTVTATDPDGLSALQSVAVIVPNQAPVLLDSIGAFELNSGDSATIDLSGHFEDPDGDSLSFAAETSDSTVVTADVSGSVVAIRALGDGSATVSLTATDPQGSSSTVAAAITVRNQAPEAVDTIPPQSVKQLQRVTIGLHPYFRDPEGGALTYSATVSDPDVATAVTSDSVVAVSGIAVGVTNVVVTAIDLGGLSAQQEFRVTVETLSDRDVLVALYHATGGPDWNRSRNWLTDAWLGSWDGVRVDGSGRVTRLYTPNNNVSGSIPPEIGGLDKLEFLNLDDNQITSLPPEIGNLASLETLWLNWNDLASLPPEIGRLSNLRDLELAQNQLSTLPAEFGDLANLEELNLFRNKFTGSFPAELFKLSRLERLFLYGNKLTGSIPPEISQLASLEQLTLGSNGLTGSIPPGIGNLTNLARLDLYRNKLTGPIPVELGNLVDLEQLELGGNRLTGPIPVELGNLVDLERLQLGGNELTGPIPSELGNLTALRSLGLGGNELTGPIPSELGNLTALRSLHLGGNELTGTIPAELGNLADLSWLTLPNNTLTGHIPAELGNLTALTYLYLNNNQLTGPVPPELGGLALLRSLRLNNNRLTGAVAPELGSFAVLESLHLNNNQLFGPVPPEFGSLAALESLDLTNNAGMSGTLPGSLTGLSLLRQFWAGGTDLCAPREAEFQRWLARTLAQRVALCLNGSASAYLTQAVQSLDFPVPLVADEEALLRVFVTAEDAGGERIPPVRARFFLDGAETRVVDIPRGTGPIAAEFIEGDLTASANANVPADLVQPGLEVVIEIDPERTLDPALGVTQRIPETGRMRIDIQAMPALQLTVVPFLWRESPDSAILDLTSELVADPENHELLWETRTLLPVRDLEIERHEPVLTSSNHAVPLGWETLAIQAIEGSGHHYMGMMSGPVDGGLVPYAFIHYRGIFSVPVSGTVAHAIGHAFGLGHAPCSTGTPSPPDPHFPNEDGSIGAWGYDFREGGSLVLPDRPDLMSACSSRWISDYSFSHSFRHRLAFQDASRPPAAAPVQSLLLWGGVDAEGDPYLEPAFVVHAPRALPRSAGEYEIAGRTSDGDALFAFSFDLAQSDDGHLGSSFAFVLPVRPEWASDLATIQLSGPSGQVTLDGDTDRPMVILRDPGTGAILGILRDTPGATLPESSADMLPAKPELQVLVSRGTPDPEAWRR